MEQVRALVNRPEFGEPPHLAIDATGVGRAVVDMFVKARLFALVHPIVIHGGAEVRRESGWFYVPKRDLVGVVVALLESEQLTFARGLALADTARDELLNFRAKINVATGAETFEAWRERDHDDIVLAIACACWLGSNLRPVGRVLGGAPRRPIDTTGMGGAAPVAGQGPCPFRPDGGPWPDWIK